MLRKNEFVPIWAGILLLLLLLGIGEVSISGVFGILRLILACFFVIFVPGYTILTALMPGSSELGFLERLSISLAFSIAVLAVMALILDRLPWGITLWPVVIFLVSLTLIMTVIALYRRRRLPPAERVLVPGFDFRRWWQNRIPVERLGFGMMIGAVLAGALVFIMMKITPVAPYTEFYILNQNQIADMYPMGTEQDINVRLGIENHEDTTQTYKIVVLVDQKFLLETDPILVSKGQRWENDLAISNLADGNSHIVEYQLLRGGDPVPYRTLRLELHLTQE